LATKEQHGLRIRIPVGHRATGQQIVERKLCRKRRRRAGSRLCQGRTEVPTGTGDRLRRFRVRTLGGCPFLFSFLQRFVNAAHIFLSLGASWSLSFNRSASVANVLSASKR